MTQGKSEKSDTHRTTGIIHRPTTDQLDNISTSSEVNTAPMQTEGEVKTLLNFVNLASCDIKAALNKSAPCKKLVDHRKYLQKQLKRFTPTHDSMALPPTHEVPLGYRHGMESPNAGDVASDLAVFPRRTSRSHLESFTSLSETGRHNMQKSRKRSLCVSDFASDAHASVNIDNDMQNNAILDHEAKKNGENAVPMRKRQLPASFWKEPSQSENHKTKSSPIVFLPDIGLTMKKNHFTNFLMKDTFWDKGLIYPPVSLQCFPQPHPPPAVGVPYGMTFNPLSSSHFADRLALNARGVDFGSCHLPNCKCSSVLCEHDSNWFPRPTGAYNGPQMPHQSDGFNPIISRHWPPVGLTLPLSGPTSECFHPPIPRVLKPVPTKSITSYPHRFHPMYS